MENPLGYGVLENSFYYLAREKWSLAVVPQTHNSWIDFGLAFGWPGITFLFIALLLPIMNFFTDRNRPAVEPIEKYAIFILLSYMIILLTSEVNFKYALPVTFFWIAFSSGVQINMSHAKIGYSK
jgi:O-antigen ligase